MARNKDRPADGVPEIVLLVRWHIRRKIISRVENIVTVEFVNVAVKTAGSGFNFSFHCAGGVSSIFRAVVRGQHPHFLNRVDAGIHVQRVVAPVVHVVAAVQLPVIVLAASAVHGIDHVSGDAHRPFILPALVVHARRQRNQLREIAAFQFQLRDFRPGDRPAYLRRLRFYLGQPFARHHYFIRNRAHFQRHVHPRLLSHAQGHAFRFVFLETFRTDADVVSPGRQVRYHPVAFRIRSHHFAHANRAVRDRDLRSGHARARRIVHRAGERPGILRESRATHAQQRHQKSKRESNRFHRCLHGPSFRRRFRAL